MILIEWLGTAGFWFAVGVVLVVADLAVGLGFFVLCFGVSAVLVGCLLLLGIPLSWYVNLVIFGFLSLILLKPIRTLAYKGQKSKKDINEY